MITSDYSKRVEIDLYQCQKSASTVHAVWTAAFLFEKMLLFFVPMSMLLLSGGIGAGD